MAEIDKFVIAIPQPELDDLGDRLRRVRWPSERRIASWERGAPVDYIKRLVTYWLESYDWRIWEAKLNEFPQFTTRIDGQAIHFLHVRSSEPSAVPLIITHGWPGSIVEFMKIIGPLTDPRAYGSDPDAAFHVVAPSVPGFGFSTPLEETGWNHERIARAWAELMRRLGYDRYGTQGGDTGSIVSPLVARIAPERVIGVHINGGLEFAAADAAGAEPLTASEQRRISAGEHLRQEGTGYAAIQSTRPQTLAYALSDSPVGQLAWIIDKFNDWTDPSQTLPEDAVDLDQLLTNITLYWLTNSAGSSAQLYFEVRSEGRAGFQKSDVPTAFAIFPTDPAVRRIAEQEHNIVRWSEFTRGGHFAAMEVPDLLVADIRSFFRALR